MLPFIAMPGKIHTIETDDTIYYRAVLDGLSVLLTVWMILDYLDSCFYYVLYIH